MCIIIYKPQGIKLFDDTLKNCFENNEDGAGFAYVENEQIHLQKGFFTLAEFMEAYDPHKTKQAVIHFRIRTHGDYEATNCHPFEIAPGIVFAHNGIISSLPTDKTKSDTVVFNELILQNLIRVYGKQILFDKTIQTILSGYIGWSKLVFLDNQGNHLITNEDKGQWISKCWFSNNTWQKFKKYAPPQHTQPTTYHKQAEIPLSKNQQKKLRHQQERLQRKFGNKIEIPSSNVIYLPNKDTQLELGSYVRVTMDVNLAQKGWLGKVMAFFENHEIEVYFPLHKRLYKLPIVYVEPVTREIIAPPIDGNPI